MNMKVQSPLYDGSEIVPSHGNARTEPQTPGSLRERLLKTADACDHWTGYGDKLTHMTHADLSQLLRDAVAALDASSPADLVASLQGLIAQWRDEEAFSRLHQAFNEANGNIQPEDVANLLKEHADELSALLASVGAHQQTTKNDELTRRGQPDVSRRTATGRGTDAMTEKAVTQ